MKKLLAILAIIIALLPLQSSAAFTVPQGGSGVGTITGIILGNGTSPFTGLTTSTGIFGAISDETGNGVLVGNILPTFANLNIGNANTTGGLLKFLEKTSNGSNFIGFQAPSAITSNVTCILEDDSNPIPDSCIGDGTDADTPTPSVGSAGAIQFSDGAGAFLGSFVDNLFYDSSSDILYLLDDTTTYYKGGGYDTGFKFNADSITAGFIHTLTVPDADMTLVGSDVSNIWTARQEFTPAGGQAGLNVGSIAGDPASTSNGDIWYDSTANELTAQINGSLVALGSGGGSGDITSVGDVTSGAAFDGTAGTILTFNDAGGDKTLEYDNTNNWFEVNAKFTPATDNTYALGTTGQYWSDLFLGDGAVIDINSDVTLTHSADALTMVGGEFRAKENLAVGNLSTSSGILKILEDTDNGSNFASFQVPALAANTVYTLPPDDGDAGEQLQTDGAGTLTWEAAGSGSGAPTTADYLVGTADAGLSAEIVVGTTPGGELGGTWASPTLDDNVTTTGWTMGTFSGTQLTSSTVLVDLLDAVGAVDMDYGSADVTDHTFVTDGTGTAEIVLPAGSIDGTEILNDTVALTTDTSGNYVANVSTDVLTGLTGGSAGSEGASLSLAFDYSQVLSGDAGLAAKSGVFGASGLVFEGDTANTIETFISVTDPTASDKTITIPNRSGTVSLSGDTFTGDVTGTLNSSGATALTVASDSVALTTDTTGNYVSSATASGGLTLTGTEGASLGVLLPAATDALSANTSSGSGLELTSSGLSFLQGCSDGQILKWVESSDVWNCATDASGGSPTWDTIGDAAGNGAIAMGETVQSMDWDTGAVTATAFDGLTLSIQDDAGTDVLTQRLLTLENKAASTQTVEVMQRILNSDTAAVTTGLLMDGNAFTTAIDLSDTDIVNALSVGLNPIKFGDLGYISDANDNELLILDTVASAVNELTLANAATGSRPTITASGSDTNIGIGVTTKGTGSFTLQTSTNVDAGLSILANATSMFIGNVSGTGNFIGSSTTRPSAVFTSSSTPAGYLTIASNDTGTNPKVSATGSDTNIGLDFQPKGTGVFRLLSTASGPSDVRWFEDTDNGTNYASLIAPASMASDRVLTLPDATDTLVGKATTDTLTNKTIAAASNVMDECLVVAASDETTSITTGTAKVTFRMPWAMTVTSVRMNLNTAGTGGTLVTVDINEGGTTILSTKLTTDASEKTSTTAATAAVISDSSLADDAEMTIDFDAVGSTVAGKGVKVHICGTI